jgi:hypothetical protein
MRGISGPKVRSMLSDPSLVDRDVNEPVWGGFLDLRREVLGDIRASVASSLQWEILCGAVTCSNRDALCDCLLMLTKDGP